MADPYSKYANVSENNAPVVVPHAEPDSSDPYAKYSSVAQTASSHHMRNTLTGRETPGKSTAGQLADLAEGTAKFSSGALLPSMVLAAPETLGALAGGALGRHIVSGIADNYMSPDAARLAGDVAAIPFGAVGAKTGGMVGPAVRAITDPKFTESVWETIPGGARIRNIGQSFVDAFHRATASPQVPRVIRDANSPAWAAHPAPVPAGVPAFEPTTGVSLPSGRVGPAPVSRINPPPAPSLPLRVPLWQQAGTQPSPAADVAAVEPIYPSGFTPSGRPFGPNIGNFRTPNEGQIINGPLIAPELPPPTAPSPAAGVPESPDYSKITSQYKPSRTRARFDANGKRIGG